MQAVPRKVTPPAASRPRRTSSRRREPVVPRSRQHEPSLRQLRCRDRREHRTEAARHCRYRRVLRVWCGKRISARSAGVTAVPLPHPAGFHRMPRLHPHAEATYRVLTDDDASFAVEVTIPGTHPTKVRPFATHRDAEHWITDHKRRVQAQTNIKGFWHRSGPRPERAS